MSGSEHSSVIFVCVFAIIFVVLSVAIPSSFFTFNPYSSQTFRAVNVPDKWDTSAIGQGNISSQDYDNTFIYEEKRAFSLTQNTPNDTILDITWIGSGYSGLPDYLKVEHRHYVFWIFFVAEDMYPMPIPEAYILSTMKDDVSSIEISCNKGDFKCLLQVSYNTTVYASFAQAWGAGNIQVWLGIRNSDTQTQAHYDAWTLIGQILIFQAPNIHLAINALIAVPFWVSLVIALLYVLKAILPW